MPVRVVTLTGLVLALGASVMIAGLGTAHGTNETVPGLPATSTAAWTTIMVVSDTSTQDSQMPSVAVDLSGNMHVAWQDETNYSGSGTDSDIFYRKWDATTRTWSATEVISTESTGISIATSLVVDAAGTVHVAWHDFTSYGGSGADADIFYKAKPAGGAWPAATEVVSTESTGSSAYPSLAVDAAGTVHVAWYDGTDLAGSGTDYDIFYKCKPAGGAWPAATEVVSTESTDLSAYPSLAVDAAGTVHVAWADGTNLAGSGTDYDTFYKCKPAGGAWPAATEVVSTESTGDSQYPFLAVDAAGTVHVAWADVTNISGADVDNDIFYKAKPAGGAWPAVTEVVSTESTSDSVYPVLAVDAAGTVHVAWYDGTNLTGSGVDADIFYKAKPAGGTWPAATVVVSTDSTGHSGVPSLVLDKVGTVHVAWQDQTNYGGAGVDWDIFCKILFRVPTTPVLEPVVPRTSTTGILELSWLPSEGASWYFIYRSVQPITWTVGLTPVARVIDGTFSETLATNGTWYYAIVAGNAHANSTVSNCAGVSVAIPPAASTGGTVPELAFFTVVGAMSAVAVLALVVGLLAGRRAAKPARQ